MRACSARQCGLADSRPIHESDLRSVPVRDQPPPVIVECMSQSERFHGINPLCLTRSMVYGICCVSVHCMNLTTCDADLVASISSVPNCGSGRQEWLF